MLNSQKLFDSGASRSVAVSGKQLRSSIIENIGEFLMELETCRENIEAQATDHITTGETVMTIGYSKTVEKFFKVLNFALFFSKNFKYII